VSRFTRLCEIPSPTGHEGEVAALVRAELESFGFEVHEDDSAGPAGAGCGNLLARIPGEDGRSIMFCAHLDTVPHAEPVRVVLGEDDVYRSAGQTILGADNKAAVAVLVELAARHRDRVPPTGIELLFTVAEEQGLRGAAAFDSSSLESDVAFVLDHATDIGEVITAAPSHHRIAATFTGVEAHSGLSPETGRSAIVAAAAAISAMDLGRIEDGTSANVGLIEGGTSGNVVPGRCSIQGEARSTDPARAIELISGMSDATLWAASSHGCDVDITTERVFGAYRVDEDSRALAIAEAALAQRGHEPRRIETGGGSDANVFTEAGIDVVLLANGTYANHTPDEYVPRANLAEMLEVCEAIVAEAGRC
jgi:tripeptide aminopeptidase